jgi:predicted lipid-binding transport protein (Tim44 family)
MNTKAKLFVTVFISAALLLSGMQEAQAKRMGGGSSFGSKPSYSKPYQPSASPAPSSQPTRSPAQQPAAAQNQTARQGWANRGGFMGMLGGLALGGLLGSLFFGGAFEGINVMDMLLFAGVAFLLYRLFAAKAARQPQTVPNAYTRNNHDDDTGHAPQSNAGFNTDVMFNKTGAANTASVPADFDRAGFLKGAESAYRYLQASWDSRDLAAIRGLTTDKVFAELQGQLRADTSTNTTEVLKVNAELLAVREVGSELEADVLFDCVIREDLGAPASVKEVWHFTKSKFSQQPKWFLDGIQQVDA